MICYLNGFFIAKFLRISLHGSKFILRLHHTNHSTLQTSRISWGIQPLTNCVWLKTIEKEQNSRDKLNPEPTLLKRKITAFISNKLKINLLVSCLLLSLGRFLKYNRRGTWKIKSTLTSQNYKTDRINSLGDLKDREEFKNITKAFTMTTKWAI